MKGKSIFLLIILFKLIVINNSVVAEERFNWKIITTWPRNFPIFHDGVEKFVDDIRLMSKGRLNITIYAKEEFKKPNGEIIPALGTFDAVSSGLVEMGHSAAYYWQKDIPGCQFMSSVPFGMTARGMNSWFYSGGGLELWRELYEPYDVIPFPMGNTGIQMAGWFNKRITTISDFRGLKMGIPGLGGLTLEKAGAKPVLLAPGAIFNALEKGEIDATEWVGPYHDKNLKLHKIAKYYYYPGWQEPGTTLELIINKTAWESLPNDLKKMVEDVSRSVNQYMYNEFEVKNIRALKEIREYGKIEILPLPNHVLDELWSLSKKVMEEESEKSPQFKKVYTAYKKFHEENNQWTRISDDIYKNGRTNASIRLEQQREFTRIGVSPLNNAKSNGSLVSLSGDITFKKGSSIINPNMREKIREIAKILLKSNNQFIIEGHTDSSGNEAYNMRLSYNRALSVKAILINTGIQPSRIKIKSYGESRPIADNSNSEGRKLNRRVEIVTSE